MRVSSGFPSTRQFSPDGAQRNPGYRVAKNPDFAALHPGYGLRQHNPVDVCINPSIISLRQAAPLHVVSTGMKRLPPNHGLFRLLLVQSIPTLFPSESLTSVNQSKRASSLLWGTSTWKPMNILAGASRRKLQMY